MEARKIRGIDLKGRVQKTRLFFSVGRGGSRVKLGLRRLGIRIKEVDGRSELTMRVGGEMSIDTHI